MDGGRRLGLCLRSSSLIQICLFLGKLRLITLNNMAGSERRRRRVWILWTAGGQVEQVDVPEETVKGERAHARSLSLSLVL